MKVFTLLLTSLSILFFSSLQAQTAGFKYSNAALKKGTLESQFQQLSYISRTSGDYKLIRRENLDLVKVNVLDSIQGYRKQIASLKDASSSHEGSTKALQDSIRTLKEQVTAEVAKIDSMSFLGLSVDKTVYNTVVWAIIAVLLAAAALFFSLFTKSKNDTLEYQLTAEKTQEEFQTLRKKSMEREQSLRRQLQDELNRKDN